MLDPDPTIFLSMSKPLYAYFASLSLFLFFFKFYQNSLCFYMLFIERVFETCSQIACIVLIQKIDASKMVSEKKISYNSRKAGLYRKRNPIMRFRYQAQRLSTNQEYKMYF